MVHFIMLWWKVKTHLCTSFSHSLYWLTLAIIRFAGAVFVGNTCIEHKAFHRYTVRKKQGIVVALVLGVAKLTADRWVTILSGCKR